MKYFCKPCKYKTTRRTNYENHVSTNKHFKNSNIKSEPKVDDIVEKLKLENERITKELEQTKVLIEERIEKEKLRIKVEMLEEQLKTKDDSLKSFQKIAEASTDTAKSSSDTLNFLMDKFKNATRITDHKLLLESDDARYKDLYKKIGYHARHNRLAQFVVEIIEEVYLNGEPNVRPFCVTDMSRNTYWTHIKNWQKDPRGTRMRKFVIKPILNTIVEEAQKYNKDAPNMHDEEEDIDKKELIRLHQKGCTMAISQIGTGELEDAVLRKLAEVCYLDKKNISIGKGNNKKEGPIIEEIVEEIDDNDKV